MTSLRRTPTLLVAATLLVLALGTLTPTGAAGPIGGIAAGGSISISAGPDRSPTFRPVVTSMPDGWTCTDGVHTGNVDVGTVYYTSPIQITCNPDDGQASCASAVAEGNVDASHIGGHVTITSQCGSISASVTLSAFHPADESDVAGLGQPSWTCTIDDATFPATYGATCGVRTTLKSTHGWGCWPTAMAVASSIACVDATPRGATAVALLVACGPLDACPTAGASGEATLPDDPTTDAPQASAGAPVCLGAGGSAACALLQASAGAPGTSGCPAPVGDGSGEPACPAAPSVDAGATATAALAPSDACAASGPAGDACGAASASLVGAAAPLLSGACPPSGDPAMPDACSGAADPGIVGVRWDCWQTVGPTVVRACVDHQGDAFP